MVVNVSSDFVLEIKSHFLLSFKISSILSPVVCSLFGMKKHVRKWWTPISWWETHLKRHSWQRGALPTAWSVLQQEYLLSSTCLLPQFLCSAYWVQIVVVILDSCICCLHSEAWSTAGWPHCHSVPWRVGLDARVEWRRQDSAHASLHIRTEGPCEAETMLCLCDLSCWYAQIARAAVKYQHTSLHEWTA